MSTTTQGNTSGGQSNALDVDLSSMDIGGLVGGTPGFDLTENDTKQEPSQQQQTQQTQQQPSVNPEQSDEQEQQHNTHPPDRTHEDDQNQQQQQQQQQQTQQQPATAPADIGAAVAAAMREVFAQNQQQQPSKKDEPPQLSAEELDRKFNAVRLKPSDMEALGLDPTNENSRAQLENLLHAAAKMGSTVATYKAELAMEQRLAAMQPIVQYVQQQQLAQLRTTFHEKFPELKGHDELAGGVYAHLKSTGFQGTNEQWLEKIGTTGKEILARVRGGQPALPAQTQQQQQQQNNQSSQTQQQNSQQNPQNGANPTHRMTTLSRGGQGGAGNSGGAPKQRNPTWDVWE